MGFENRDYYRNPGGPGDGLARVGRWLLYGRVFLFRAFGIDVYALSWLIIAIVLTLLFMRDGYQWQDRVIAAALLFLIVLLHEFGHCFGARWAGGDADEIAMHPLGGLALTRPPPTWQGHFITTACGPLVNVALCIVCGIAYYMLRGYVPWKPYFLSTGETFHGWLEPSWLLFWIYQANWMLLLFNLLPIYPLDGGRLVQELLWPKFGYYRSMWFAANTGLVGAIIGGMIAIASGAVGLLILAALGVMHCLSMKRQLRHAGPWGFGEYDDPLNAVMHRSQRENRRHDVKAQRLAAKQARRAEQERAQRLAESAEIDRILAKVSANGMQSLTRGEQKILRQATERQQKRDAGRR